VISAHRMIGDNKWRIKVINKMDNTNFFFLFIYLLTLSLMVKGHVTTKGKSTSTFEYQHKHENICKFCKSWKREHLEIIGLLFVTISFTRTLGLPFIKLLKEGLHVVHPCTSDVSWNNASPKYLPRGLKTLILMYCSQELFHLIVIMISIALNLFSLSLFDTKIV